MELGVRLIVWTIVAALLSKPLYQLLGRTRWLQQTKCPGSDAPTQRHLRERTLRVDDIPSGISAPDLESDLQSAIGAVQDLKGQVEGLVVRSLTPRNSAYACATITVWTSLPEAQLVARLKRVKTATRYSFDCTFDGITPLYDDPSGSHCDVIAVPGLASHAIGSWKTPGEDENEIWLRDWLPADIKTIRVLLYGYDTTLLKSTSKSSIEDLGRSLLEDLSAFRASDMTERRPIILIGHSLGGLLIKEALVHSSRSPATSPKNQLLSQTCCGVLFFGVPQLGLRNEKLLSVVEGRPNQALVQAMVVDDESEPSDFLARMSDDFARCFQDRLRVISFYERKLSPTIEMQPDGRLTKTGPPVLMVTRKSATSTGLTAVPEEDIVCMHDADHSTLTKFTSRTNGPYIVVKERIKSLVSAVGSWTTDSPTRSSTKKLPQPVIQHGSTFGGNFTMYGGNVSQGNVMNI